MFVILKLLQSLIRTLHSEGTPAQIAAGAALGAALGLTPLTSPHNALVIAMMALLNVSFGAGMLAMVIFAPLGFALDPLFDRIGSALLLSLPALRPLWLAISNTPVLAFFNFNNTVVAGSIAGWLILALPIYFLARFSVVRYRESIGARVRQSRAYKAIRASRVYNVYSWFRE
jgi:uncharacterized protein (TIGR03546 family)